MRATPRRPASPAASPSPCTASRPRCGSRSSTSSPPPAGCPPTRSSSTATAPGSASTRSSRRRAARTGAAPRSPSAPPICAGRPPRPRSDRGASAPSCRPAARPSARSPRGSTRSSPTTTATAPRPRRPRAARARRSPAPRPPRRSSPITTARWPAAHSPRRRWPRPRSARRRRASAAPRPAASCPRPRPRWPRCPTCRCAPAPAPPRPRAAKAAAAPPPPCSKAAAPAPDDGLPERLRYAYTRLAGPDEPGRGRLWPVDATAHLRTLVADHDPDAADALPRAVAALEAAAARLANAPTPPGTEPLPPDGYPVVRDATGAHDVPGDGRWHRVPVVTRTAAAAVDFRAVPRESNDVWRFCTVHLDDGEPLPQGPLRIHVDGRYRATGRLRGTGGGEPIEMNLGLEPALRIIDRKVEMMQEDRGLMTQSTRVEHRVTTKIRSALDHPARLVVYDRLPVRDDPDDDRVAVEPLDTRPPAERTDRAPDGAPLDGGLRWRLDIPARGVVTVEHGYRITFPAKLELSGGNRRE
ncbi:MAG: DUF4139 domain-containing protein [Myxococcales bacterium]|nr:DUF4139 domain-containing protein [Myxococcales bacterium]